MKPPATAATAPCSGQKAVVKLRSALVAASTTATSASASFKLLRVGPASHDKRTDAMSKVTTRHFAPVVIALIRNHVLLYCAWR